MGFRLRRSARLGPLRFLFAGSGLSSISVGGRGASLNIPVDRPGRARTTVGLPGTGLSWNVEVPAGAAAGLPNSRRLRPGQLDAFKASVLDVLHQELFGPGTPGQLLSDSSPGGRLAGLLAVIETPEAMAAYITRARSQHDVKRRAHRCIEALQEAQRLVAALAPATAAAVLRFWFEQCEPRQWFSKDQAFDDLVRARFIGAVHAAIAGELTSWGAAPGSALALVLLLDQFPRQIWRHSAMAFAGDGQALALSLAAVDRGWLAAEPEPARRQFWLMPRMHSEELAVQEAALPLFEQFSDARTAEFARRHRDVIARFGRFPHRNAALGRVSSLAEVAFLQTPGSRF
ncbi:MAG: DUF924 family protein [Cyanobacteria bacterium J06638_7]